MKLTLLWEILYKCSRRDPNVPAPRKLEAVRVAT